MHTIAPSAAAVNEDLAFVIALPEATTEEGLVPYMLGVSDAEDHALCVPEMYYTSAGQALEYIEGFESVAGITLLSSQARTIWGGN